MLTGRVTFAGDTVSDTIAKILEREPDWSALPAATPAPVRRLLLRCLAKDPKQRLRDIGDVRIEIDAIDEVLPATSEEVVTLPLLPGAAPRGCRGLAIVALAVAIGVREASRPAPTPENPLANAQFTRFTDWEGTEGGAEISPDGRFVAFLADPGGSFDLWQSQVGTGRFVNLTPDMPPLMAPGTLLRNFGFSGDGAEIWFSSSGGATSRKMLMPLTGGTPRPFLAEGAAAPAWSPDGTRLAYITVSESGDPLSVADRTGADAREIVSARERMHNHNPVWSPDGQWIYFVHGSDPTDEMDVWRVRPSGGSPEQTDAAARRGELPGATRPAHAALRGARRGLVGAVAVGPRRGEQDRTPGERGPRAVHVGGGQPRRPARGRHRGQPHGQPVARAARRPARRRARCRAVPRADGAGAGATLRRDVACSICPRAAWATGCGGSRTGRSF